MLTMSLTKVDEVQGLIWATASTETPDKDKEIFDYASSKPEIQAWSDRIFKTSGGKSYGNIRSMHENISAGKIVEPIGFDDEGKRVEVCIKVVDKNELAKVAEGIYTGLSFGGSYKKRWADPVNPMFKRYTASPTELSLADNPCVPDAVFELVKTDGSKEMRKFAKAAPAPKAKTKNTEPENMLTKIALLIQSLSELRKISILKTLQKGAALKSLTKLRTDMMAMQKAVASQEPKELKKGMYGVSSLASAIASIDCITRDQEFEAEMEGDDSDLPEKLAEARKMLGDILVEMAQEETAELDPDAEPSTTGDPDMEPTNAEKLAKVVELLGSINVLTMNKAAKVSAKDSVQAIHDASVQLGATHNDMHDGEAGIAAKGEGDGDGDEKDEEKEGDDEATKTAKAKRRAEKLAKLAKVNPAIGAMMKIMAAQQETLNKLTGAPANGNGPQATDAERLAKIAELNFPQTQAAAIPSTGTVAGENAAGDFLKLFKVATASPIPVNFDSLAKLPKNSNLAKLAS